MNIKEELIKKTEHVRDAFLKDDYTCLKEAGSELMNSLFEALESGIAEEEDLEPIKDAVGRCLGRYIFDYETVKSNTDRLTDRIISLVNDKKVDKSTKVIWIRSLLRVLHRSDIRRIAESTTLSYFSRFYLPAMEEEADEMPSPELMAWYEEFLEKDPGYRITSLMFNRMAYYWLHGYCQSSEYSDRAKALFKAMERRGIEPRNPYNGYYGKSDHEDLINDLLNGDYDSCKRTFFNSMVSGLVKEMASGDAEAIDLYEFEDTMYQIHMDNMYDCREIDTAAWDQTIRDCCEALKECCEKVEKDGTYATSARTIAKCLVGHDNWLLRYIEMENGSAGEDEYYSQVEEWLGRIKAIADDSTWVMISSLQGILINRYKEIGETEKLIAILKNQTAGVDVASYLTGYQEVCYKTRYCTNNTMALINILAENGRTDEVREIIKEVNDSASAVEDGWIFPKTEKIALLWLKYINLLELYGYTEEAAEWKEKLATEFDMSDDRIEAELCYLRGDHEEALSRCRIILSCTEEASADEKGDDISIMAEMLEYIVNDRLPEVSGDLNVVRLAAKPPEAIHCRGTFNTDELTRAIQMTNEEWHLFSATSTTLAEMFVGSLKKEKPEVYPREYYMAPAEYMPEPAIMRGDFIHYLYREKTGKGWLGLTEKDVDNIWNNTTSF